MTNKPAPAFFASILLLAVSGLLIYVFTHTCEFKKITKIPYAENSAYLFPIYPGYKTTVEVAKQLNEGKNVPQVKVKEQELEAER